MDAQTLRLAPESVDNTLHVVLEHISEGVVVTNAREIGEEMTARYVDEDLDRVELIYNRYVSPLTQYVRRQTLLPIQHAEVFGEGVGNLPRDDVVRYPLDQKGRPWVAPLWR